VLEGSHFGARGIPQYRVERMLEEWVTELGARVLRGHEVVDLRTYDDHVVAVVEGPDGVVEHRAEYLVACDGGRSTVRHLAGFGFPGTDATRECYLADVVGRDIRPRFIGERVAGGMVMSAPLEDGVDRIIVCENGRKPSGDREVTFDEVADAWQRLTGESLHGAEIRWVSAFSDATRQVTQYRRHRVLIAGDAAHIHLPAGGQGLSVGIQDAVNLGWKLAATVRGRAPGGLLDSYHHERHPVGARVLRNTLAQGMLYLSGAEIEPLRSVVAELVAIPVVGRHLSGMVSGLDIHYEVGGNGHPLQGMRMPNWELRRPDGTRVRIAELLHQARGVLLCLDGPAGLAAEWSDRIDVVAAAVSGADGTELESVLIRPDGYVAWAAPGGGDLRAALDKWFGAARVAAARS
jgi:bifunctional hydroxylase/dehydrase